VDKKDILALSKHIDAAHRTLNDLRIKCGCDELPVLQDAPEARHTLAHTTAKRILKNRRSRGVHFGEPEIFGEPAWDILLDLYVHQIQNDEVSVKSASIGSGAPATTALRWINILEDKKLIVSELDLTDHRRRLVRLTAEGFESMTRYLELIARQGST
jgi:hypothetical protein